MIAMKEKFAVLKTFNWRLFIALCVLALVPAIYMNTIILMFGFGMIVHWAISIIEEKIFYKGESLK